MVPRHALRRSQELESYGPLVTRAKAAAVTEVGKADAQRRATTDAIEEHRSQVLSIALSQQVSLRLRLTAVRVSKS